jgi:hypothetical protein
LVSGDRPCAYLEADRCGKTEGSAAHSCPIRNILGKYLPRLTLSEVGIVNVAAGMVMPRRYLGSSGRVASQTRFSNAEASAGDGFV